MFTVQVQGEILIQNGFFAALAGIKTEGYEIHMGETVRAEGAEPFQMLSHGAETSADGCVKGHVFGTYQHGLFDSAVFLERLAGLLAARCGTKLEVPVMEAAQYREAQYDRLAELVRGALDMERIYRILEGDA